MPYALFTALPFVGHLNPLVRQAAELQRRGWRVGVAATREMLPHLAGEAPAIPLIDLGPLGAIVAELRHAEATACADGDYRRGGLKFMGPLARIWPVMFDGLVAAIERDRPDVMVIDIFTWAGIAAADATGVPAVINNPSLLTGVPLELMPPDRAIPFPTSGQSLSEIGAFHRAIEPVIRYAMIAGIACTVGRAHKALRKSRGLAPLAIHEPLRNRRIMVNGAFGLEYQRALPPNVEMVGPMLPATEPPLPADFDAWLSDGPPVIYVNLGTVSVAQDDQLARLAGGLTIDGMRVLWVVKPQQADRLPRPLPPAIRLTSWVPSPRGVLAHPNVRLFVSHCGVNSVHESLVAGTPIVGIPMLADQRDMAARVADAGVGVWLEKTRFTSETLRHAITRVLTEPAFRDRIPAVQAAFARAGGLQRAVDVIEAATPTRPR